MFINIKEAKAYIATITLMGAEIEIPLIVDHSPSEDEIINELFERVVMWDLDFNGNIFFYKSDCKHPSSKVIWFIIKSEGLSYVKKMFQDSFNEDNSKKLLELLLKENQ